MTTSSRVTRDVRKEANYGIDEAARWIGLKVTRVKSWTSAARRKGSNTSLIPIILPAAPDSSRLSFENLAELHILRAILLEYHFTLSQLHVLLD
jgi:hypothetical protein